MTWVLKHSRSKGTTRCVLLAIADHASSDGTNAWPSHATLARYANTSVASVKRSIAWLKEHEEVGVEVAMGGTTDTRWDRRPNRYTVLMHGGADLTPRGPITVPEFSTGGSDVNPGSSDDGGSSVIERGVTGEPRGGSTLSYDPPLNHPDPSFASTDVEAVDNASLGKAILKACELDPTALTSSALGVVAKAVRELQAVGADPAAVPAAATAYRRRYPHATLTATALAKHWPSLVPATTVPRAVSRAERLGISLRLTTADEDVARAEIEDELDDDAERAVALAAYRRKVAG